MKLSPDVKTFLSTIADTSRQKDAEALLAMMHDETKETPYMYGASIIGFGTYHYKYESGREGDTVIVGFAPRKTALVIYGVIFYDQGTDKLKDLGPHTQGKGCLYIKHLSDVNEAVLRDMIRAAYRDKHHG